jgi:hypothetical protein
VVQEQDEIVLNESLTSGDDTNHMGRLVVVSRLFQNGFTLY